LLDITCGKIIIYAARGLAAGSEERGRGRGEAEGVRPTISLDRRERHC
jgi:hypothetical protein